MLFLNNEDVARLLTVEDALHALEEGHRDLAAQRLVSRPRIDIYTETDAADRLHRWGTMEGSSKSLRRLAIRVKSDIVSWPTVAGRVREEKYCLRPGLYCGLVLLFDTESGQPLAIINDGLLQHVRVGALAALGDKYLAKPNASCVGMIGSGGMARSHLEAFAAVRPIKRAKVYSPNAENRERYAREMGDRTGIDVIPCESAVEAVAGVDVVATCTSSEQATVFASMLEPGMHLTKVAREWAPDVLPMIDVSIGGDASSQVVQGKGVDDSMGFPTYLAGSHDALRAAKGAHRHRRRRGDVGSANSESAFSGRVVPLAELIAGSVPGRASSEEISSSGGVLGGPSGKQGLQFVTVGSLVYDRANAAGVGRRVPTEWFLQDIRD